MTSQLWNGFRRFMLFGRPRSKQGSSFRCPRRMDTIRLSARNSSSCLIWSSYEFKRLGWVFLIGACLAPTSISIFLFHLNHGDYSVNGVNSRGNLCDAKRREGVASACVAIVELRRNMPTGGKQSRNLSEFPCTSTITKVSALHLPTTDMPAENSSG
jgi:hypothetical protein